MVSVALVVAGCAATGSSEGDGEAVESASPSPTPTPSLAAGVELTEPGTRLSFGDAATVAYAPNTDRSGALQLRVVSVRQGSADDLAAYELGPDRRSTPYYVTVRAANVGEADLGGAALPLWADAGDRVVQASVFLGFERCTSAPLPKRFGPGERHRGCLVYLVRRGDRLESVSNRGLGEAEPVTWTGTVEQPRTKGRQGRKGEQR